mmetsp:Transcript_101832/g.288253  ORF Transcript_101832/g.288253 Transcript_101832/m.288253 type:complete len:187 (-) Transcript_101832:385-945(-)
MVHLFSTTPDMRMSSKWPLPAAFAMPSKHLPEPSSRRLQPVAAPPPTSPPKLRQRDVPPPPKSAPRLQYKLQVPMPTPATVPGPMPAPCLASGLATTPTPTATTSPSLATTPSLVPSSLPTPRSDANEKDQMHTLWLPLEVEAEPAWAQPGHCDKPLKVCMQSYECEVPLLDPRVPAKKQLPKWSF